MNESYKNKIRVFMANMQDRELKWKFWHEFSYQFGTSCNGCEYYVDNLLCVSAYKLRKVLK